MTCQKAIRSAADLAINGAPPAFSVPIPVGRPNIGDRAAFMALVGDIFDRGWLSNNGPMVERFEQRVASELGVKHCITVCNGTIGLEIAIRALGLTGEVIVPSYTFIATAHSLSWLGLTPVFAEVDPGTHNIDPDAIADLITPRTSGIIATHLWGRPCDVDRLQAIADAHGLSLIFDAAHAFLCSHGDQMIGGFGRAEVFSFHATKFFNAFEGGAITTNDDELAHRIRLMRNFGFAALDNSVVPGTNGKMTEICAAMGLVNLDNVATVVKANHDNYRAYQAAFEGINGISIIDPSEEPFNYQYVVAEVDGRFPCSRDAIVEALQAEHVMARRYFWPGCHRMKSYCKNELYAGFDMPKTDLVANRVIVLPTGTGLPEGTIEVIRDVCTVLSDAKQES